MGFLFILIIIVLFIAYSGNAKVRKKVDKSPGITWFGSRKRHKRKNKKYFWD